MIPIVIGLSGRMGSGKTTTARYVKSYIEHYTKAPVIISAFGDVLRKEVAAWLKFENKDVLKVPTVKSTYLAEYWEKAGKPDFPEGFPKHLITETTTVRELLQYWGTNYRREHDPFYWTGTYEYQQCEWLNSIKHSIRADFSIIICDDVRFPNEYFSLTRIADRYAKGQHYHYYINHFERENEQFSWSDMNTPEGHVSEYMMAYPDFYDPTVFHGTPITPLSPAYGQLQSTAMLIAEDIITSMTTL